MQMLISQATIGQLQSFLLWSAVLNYAVLLVGVGAWFLAGDRLYRLHARLFGIEPAQCRVAVYLLLGVYKLGIWLLFVVPWIALCIVYGAGGPQ